MSDMCLYNLPVEILHNVFDHLNVQDILLSVRRVCKKLYEVSITYDRFVVKFGSIPYANLRCISRLICPENIIKMNLYISNSVPTEVELFFSNFDPNQFTRLKVLTLKEPEKIELEHFLRCINTATLTSLSIDFNEESKRSTRTLALLSSVVAEPKLQRLYLNYSGYMRKHISWTTQCSLSCLRITNCTYNEYLDVLSYCPHLRTFIMQYITMTNNYNNTLSTSAITPHRQLNILMIDECQLPIKYLKTLLSLTPSLMRLKLVSLRSTFDEVFDGSFWMRFIQSQLSSLHDLNFFFKYRLRKTDNFLSIDAIIAKFRAPFWLKDKQWFVTCDYIINKCEIVLYTESFRYINQDVLIRNKAFSMDTVYILPRCHINNLPNHETQETVSLAHEQIGESETKYLCNALRNNNIITTLYLNFNQIGPLGMLNLATAFRNNNTLSELHLRKNSIGAEGAQHLVNALENNTTLTMLVLSENQIGELGAKHIADLLQKNKTLTTLNIRLNQTKASGTKYLVDALQNNTNTKLMTFDIGRNEIGALGAQYIGDLLQSNKTLTILKIGENQIFDLGTQYISEALHINQTLTTLNLFDNQIGESGGIDLATALENNKALIELKLEGNQIGAIGAQHFASALRTNTTLKTLDIRSNGIGDQGAQCLADALQCNKTLTKLELTVKPESTIQQSIEKMIKQNKSQYEKN